MELSQVAAISGSLAAQAGAAPLPKSRIAAHGLDNRGLETASSPGVGYGRFGRMFTFTGGGLKHECLLDIAIAMIKDDNGAPHVRRHARPPVRDQQPQRPVRGGQQKRRRKDYTSQNSSAQSSGLVSESGAHREAEDLVLRRLQGVVEDAGA